MNAHVKPHAAAATLIRPDAATPIFKVTGHDSIVVKAGTVFGSHSFSEDTPVPLHLNAAGQPGYVPGGDYAVSFDGVLSISRLTGIPDGATTLLGGFHYAPGGNATARRGGDDIAAINPFSLWDIAFRPACADPRGMTLVETSGGHFWCDIYLTGVDHLANGTSKFGVTIADGNDQPRDATGKSAKRFDYETAKAVMAAHGKGLLGLEEFFAAAFGVTEKTAARRDPVTTGLDVQRTSRFGLMQATGNLWVWGHDGDPDEPRASILGGSWFSGNYAGSRCAFVVTWGGNSSGSLGARGRSDHLNLG